MRVRHLCKVLLMAIAALFMAALFSASSRLHLDDMIPIYLRVDSATYTYDGNEHTIKGFTVQYVSSKYIDDVEVVWDLKLARTNAGSVSTTESMKSKIKVYYKGRDISDTALLMITHGTLTINPAPITIVLEEETRTYNGKSQFVQLGFTKPSGMAEGDYVLGTFNISGRDAGYYSVSSDAPVTIAHRGTNENMTANYRITLVGGLSIRPVARYAYEKGTPTKAPSLPEAYSVIVGNSYEVAKTPALAGYSFSGWHSKYVRIQDGRYIVPPGANEIIFTGFFVPIPEKKKTMYTLSYYIDGEVYHTEQLEKGQKIEPPQEPMREGSEFSGWLNMPDTMPGNDVDIEGSFEEAVYTIEYINDGELYTTQKYTQGSVITPPPMEGVEGFQAWAGLPSFMPANDLVVIAAFTSGPSNPPSPPEDNQFFPIVPLALCALAIAGGAANSIVATRRKEAIRFVISLVAAFAAIMQCAASVLFTLPWIKWGGALFVAVELVLAGFAMLGHAIGLKKARNNAYDDDDEDIDRLNTGEYEVIRPEDRDRTTVF